MAAAVLLILGAVGTAVLVAGDDGETDPVALLESAQAVVEDTATVRVQFEGHNTVGVGVTGPAVETTVRFSGAGERDGERWWTLVDYADQVNETVWDGGTGYDRWAADSDGLEDEQWEAFEPASPGEMVLEDLDYLGTLTAEMTPGWESPAAAEVFDAMVAVAATQSVFVGGGSAALPEVLIPDGWPDDLVGDPRAFLEAIELMDDPTVLSEDGDVTTLAGTLSASDDQTEAFGRAIPEGRVELDVGDGDRPTGLRFDVSEGQSSYGVEIGFTDWGESVDIEVPEDDAIDPTPWVDEEGLRDIEDLTLVWPTAPPAGWDFTVWSPAKLEDQQASSGCGDVGLDWDESIRLGVPGEGVQEAGYLYLTLRPVACALDRHPQPFAPGGPAGLPSRTDEFGLVEVQVGDTAVEFDSSLRGADLDAVLASLAPVDVETIIAAAE